MTKLRTGAVVLLAFVVASHAVDAECHSAADRGVRRTSLTQGSWESTAKKPMVRPGAGGAPDHVNIGIMCKAYYGLDLKEGTSTMDLVTYMSWTDSRVSSIVPGGLDQLSLSLADAKKLIWLPGIAITNRDIASMEAVSSTIDITKTGNVTKVDRMMVTVRSKVDIRAFPFDTQEITVYAASATLMSDSLVFDVVSDPMAWGVDSAIFAGKSEQLEQFRMRAFEETAGALKKSRVAFIMTLKRDAASYVPSLFVPQIVCAIVVCAAFWLPLTPPFVMPRVAIALFTLLTVTAHRQSTARMLPGGSSLCWTDIFEELTLIHVFSCCVLNIFVEGLAHQQKNPELAERMNAELKTFLPALCIVLLGLCFWIRDAESVTTLAWIVRSTLSISLGIYTVFSVRRSAT